MGQRNVWVTHTWVIGVVNKVWVFIRVWVTHKGVLLILENKG